MTLDFTKTFASSGELATISEEEWIGGWAVIVGGINGIPTAQQFNAVSNLIEAKTNEAYRVAALALRSVDGKVDKMLGYGLIADADLQKLQKMSTGATKTSASAISGNIVVDGEEVQVYRHPTGPGSEHIPAGGAENQVLIKTASGYGWGDQSITKAEAPIKDAEVAPAIDGADTIPFTDVSADSKTKRITLDNLKSQVQGGDAKDSTVTFTEAATREPLASGEKLSVLFGKTKRFFTDLKGVAFSAKYGDLLEIPTAFPPSEHKHSAGDINGGILGVPCGGTGKSTFPVGNILVGAGAGALNSVPPGDLVKIVGLAYGVCTTAASTAAKVVNITGFALNTGAHVAVTFTNAVPKNATLNVNGTGAKAMKWTGDALQDGAILPGDTCEFVYTGSEWLLLVIDRLAATGGVSSVSFAADSWDTINRVCSLGKHRDFYKIGDTKTITLTNNELVVLRIEDFDHDDLVTGGKAPVSIGMADCFKAYRRMATSNTNTGGWNSCEMRNAGMAEYLAMLPDDLRNVIKPVIKLTSAGSQSTSLQTTQDRLWLFSYNEVNFPVDANYSPGGEGRPYPLFVNDVSRIKKVNGSAAHWWLRSPFVGNTTSFDIVISSGARSNTGASTARGVALGFCI